MDSSQGAKLGPLRGLRIVEFAGIGPAPYAGMLLADLGADVIRIDRYDAGLADPGHRVLGRGRRSLALNLKQPAAIALVRRLLRDSDALIEGFRPGVMERLGLGPSECRDINPRLVFGRVTGWGQEGPLANAPGHDINYIAITGLLNAIGTRDSGPVAPLNLLGDFAGGGLFLAFGVLAAILEARNSGQGQVVDAAMVDGASSLGSLIWGMRSGGFWPGARGENMLDGGSHFYGVFECADGKWVTLASIESEATTRTTCDRAIQSIAATVTPCRRARPHGTLARCALGTAPRSCPSSELGATASQGRITSSVTATAAATPAHANTASSRRPG